MAHMIENNSVFTVGKPAWHKLGVTLETAPNCEQAWKLAYPHTLHKLPIQAIAPNGAVQDIEDHCYIVRSDGKAIGPVTKGYELLQPYEIMKGFERYIDQNLCTLESGGSLNEGKRMWILAKINNASADIVKGDKVDAYILAYTGFDGSLCYGEKLTAIRVVCNNTLQASFGSTLHNQDYKFRHTKTIRARVGNAKATIEATIKQFYRTTEAYKALADKRMTSPQMEAYIRRVFVTAEKEQELKEQGKELPNQTITKINHVIDLLDNQAGYDLVPAMHGTAWQAYNAVTQYLTHDAGRSDDTRLNSQWFGASSEINARAFDLALSC